MFFSYVCSNSILVCKIFYLKPANIVTVSHHDCVWHGTEKNSTMIGRFLTKFGTGNVHYFYQENLFLCHVLLKLPLHAYEYMMYRRVSSKG